MNRKLFALAATAAMALVRPAPNDELVGTRGVDEIRRRNEEAERHRGQMKRSARAAANELVEVGAKTIVLGHIHPRWLRIKVGAHVLAGENVTADDVERWRAEGMPT